MGIIKEPRHPGVIGADTNYEKLEKSANIPIIILPYMVARKEEMLD